MTTCSTESAMIPASGTVEAPVDVLGEIVRRYGTPTYAYDIPRIRAQVARLREHLPAQVEIFYSLKANASLGLCGVLAKCGVGTDVASAGELAIALAAGFTPNRIFLTGPDRCQTVLDSLNAIPDIIVSADSPSDLVLLGIQKRPHCTLVRLRPDFSSYATCSAGPDSRFGLTWNDVANLPSCPPNVIGFHVFSGSQILSAEGLIHHMRGGVDLALRAAKELNIVPEIIDLGGGFGIPYAPGDQEVDLDVIAAELRTLIKRAAPARIVFELGRYLVAQSGWYLTKVLAEQTHRGRPAVVVDGGSHQRGDMCGLGLRQKGYAPNLLGETNGETRPTDVLGCLSLPGDVLAEARMLPPLGTGDVLAFPNAGAYGMTASPWLFHGHPAPAEIAFDGDVICPLRLRKPPESVLDGQLLMNPVK